jgi:hypothetical protein
MAGASLAKTRIGRSIMRWLLLTFIVLSSLMFGGCEIVGGIFKAGVWVGVIAVVLVLVLVGFLATKLRR